MNCKYEILANIVSNTFPPELRDNTIDFFTYLNDNSIKFERIFGYWKNQFYWQVNYKNQSICYILINGTGYEKRFAPLTIWTDDSLSDKDKKTKHKKRREMMKRELGIARCGLACCLCSENDKCTGCNSGDCPDKDWCENRKCSIEKGVAHCYECDEDCRKTMLSKMKSYAFTRFAKQYGKEYLLDCLETNEKKGIVYHRDGIFGDYDDFDDVEKLIDFIKNGE